VQIVEKAQRRDGPDYPHHFHFFTADPDALRAWYVKMFGVTSTPRGAGVVTSVPGAEFSFRKTDKPQAATKGRSLDHIGFEAKGLEAFCKKLAANGVTFETPFRDVPRIELKIAFLVDPAGTRIELTEDLAGRLKNLRRTDTAPTKNTLLPVEEKAYSNAIYDDHSSRSLLCLRAVQF
jgi:catechol 2,3-dioxygenase-like lactoylglutathione lyase family enzyme